LTFQSVQECKYGCGKTIQLRKTDAGWRPFEESGEMHDCPKSPYNLKKQQGGTAPRREEQESSVHYQILQELRKTNEFLDRSNRLLAKIAGVED